MNLIFGLCGVFFFVCLFNLVLQVFGIRAYKTSIFVENSARLYCSSHFLKSLFGASVVLKYSQSKFVYVYN